MEIAIKFANWLSQHYNIDNGIGYWTDHVSDDSWTTEELWKIFNDTELRKLKIEKIKK